MRPHARRHFLISSLLAGCVPEFEQVQGSHLLYEYSTDLHACAGNAAYADSTIPFLESQLDVTAPMSLRYSWISPGDVSSAFVLDTVGVTIGRHAMAYVPYTSHELTHAVMGGISARFFAEGAAVAMQILYDGRGPRYLNQEALLNEDWDPRPSMTATRSEDVHYAVAGAFVTYLLVQHGPAAFREFYRALGGPVTMKMLQREFKSAYGVELETEVELFLQGVPECKANAFPVQPTECMVPPQAWQDEQSWRLQGSMDCDDKDVIGGITPNGATPSFRAATIDVAEPGFYFIRFERTEEAWLRFGRCFGCPWQQEDTIIEGKVEITEIGLEAGRHYIRIGSWSDLSAEVSVEVTR